MGMNSTTPFIHISGHQPAIFSAKGPRSPPGTATSRWQLRFVLCESKKWPCARPFSKIAYRWPMDAYGLDVTLRNPNHDRPWHRSKWRSGWSGWSVIHPGELPSGRCQSFAWPANPQERSMRLGDVKKRPFYILLHPVNWCKCHFFLLKHRLPNWSQRWFHMTFHWASLSKFFVACQGAQSPNMARKELMRARSSVANSSMSWPFYGLEERFFREDHWKTYRKL